MQDPKPENIKGAKTVSHHVEHRVDWGYVIGGVGVLVLAYVLFRIFDPGLQDDENSTFE